MGHLTQQSLLGAGAARDPLNPNPRREGRIAVLGKPYHLCISGLNLVPAPGGRPVVPHRGPRCGVAHRRMGGITQTGWVRGPPALGSGGGDSAMPLRCWSAVPTHNPPILEVRIKPPLFSILKESGHPSSAFFMRSKNQWSQIQPNGREQIFSGRKASHPRAQPSSWLAANQRPFFPAPGNPPPPNPTQRPAFSGQWGWGRVQPASFLHPAAVGGPPGWDSDVPVYE